MFRLSADTLTKIKRKLPHVWIIRNKNLKIILFFCVVCMLVWRYPNALFELVFISVRRFPSSFLSIVLKVIHLYLSTPRHLCVCV
jgi:hypothetical protein